MWYPLPDVQRTASFLAALIDRAGDYLCSAFLVIAATLV
jgi:hypothetical protein